MTANLNAYLDSFSEQAGINPDFQREFRKGWMRDYSPAYKSQVYYWRSQLIDLLWDVAHTHTPAQVKAVVPNPKDYGDGRSVVAYFYNTVNALRHRLPQ